MPLICQEHRREGSLLSAIDSIADAGPDAGEGRCGFLLVAGRSVIQHQLECALALGCEKIVCQAIGLPQELLAIQHQAEKAGAQFQVISGPRALSGMVKAADELLVLADALLPDRAAAEAALAGKPTVLTIPADDGVAAGYERIDRDHAWAGLFLVRGPAVERLGELSPGADPVAGLLRIALQTGTRTISLPGGVLTHRKWGLVRTEQEAQAMEAAWLERHARSASFAAPSLALADRLAIAVTARRGGRIPSNANILACAAGLGIIASLTGWFWEPFAGMAVAALAFFAHRIGVSLGLIERIGQAASANPDRFAGWLGAALDALLIALTAMVSDGTDQASAILTITILLVALHLGGALPLRGWKILLADRSLLAAVLAVSIYFSQLSYVSQLLALFVLLAMFFDYRRSKITPI